MMDVTVYHADGSIKTRFGGWVTPFLFEELQRVTRELASGETVKVLIERPAN